jgi:hypothetical protein
VERAGGGGSTNSSQHFRSIHEPVTGTAQHKVFGYKCLNGERVATAGCVIHDEGTLAISPERRAAASNRHREAGPRKDRERARE